MTDTIKNKLDSVVKEVDGMNKRGYIFPFSAAKDFDGLFHVFSNIRNLTMSKKLFEEILGKMYAKLKWPSFTVDKLLSRLNDIFKSKKDKYYFISALNHVNIKGDLKIGRIRLVKLDEETIAALKSTHNHSEFNGYKNKDVAIYGPFPTSSFEEARIIGLKRVEEFLNILRVIFDFIEDGNSGFKTQFGINTINYGQHASFDSDSYFPNATWTRQFIIPQNLSKIQYYPIIEYLWSLIDTENEVNEIKQRIIDSLHWFGVAKMSHDRKQQFISYFVLLEGLLFAGSDGSKTSDLSERITKILFCDQAEKFSSKIRVYEKIRVLYKLRGNLVHEAEVSIGHDSLRELNSITREVFIKYIKISQSNSFETKKDLRNWILSQKL